MFIEEYLQDVRRDRYAPAAFVRYARRVASHVRENLYANPGAVRSIWSVGPGFFATAFLCPAIQTVAGDRGPLPQIAY